METILFVTQFDWNLMKNPPHSQQFSTGRLVLSSPCHIGAEAMTALNDGNRFCRDCKKVVHQLDGKSETEIKALFAANGGNICGSMRFSQPRQRQEIQLAAPTRRAAYWKQLAATASLLLLYQGMMAAPRAAQQGLEWVVPAFAPAQQPRVGDNTILSAVIQNEEGVELPFDFAVEIFADGVLLRRTVAEHGLLKVDFEGLLAPEANIVIVVLADSATDPLAPIAKMPHGGMQQEVRLADAQNLVLKVRYDFPTIETVTFNGGMTWEPEERKIIPMKSKNRNKKSN